MARDLASEGLELKIGGLGEKYEVMREKHRKTDGSYDSEFCDPLEETLKGGFSGKFVVAKKEDGFYFFFEPVSIAHAEIALEYGLAEDLSGCLQGKPAAPWESIMGGGMVSVYEGELSVYGLSGSYSGIPFAMAKDYTQMLKGYLIDSGVEVSKVRVEVRPELKPVWDKFIKEEYLKKFKSGRFKGARLAYEEILK